MKFKKNGGFTLVELIVVIAILAILAGVAVPAYSGYIAKAEKAADMQLLGAVNQAFGAACLEEGISTNDVVGAHIVINEDGKIGTIGSVTVKNPSMSGTVQTASASSLARERVAKIAEAFANYYAGNEDKAFKVLKSLFFHPEKHCFVDPETIESNETFEVYFNGMPIQVSGSTLQKMNSSTYGQIIGAEALMGEVSDLTKWADEDGNAILDTLGDPYYDALARYLGVDSVDDYLAELEAMGKGAEANAVLTNGIVMYAAENFGSMSDSDINDLLLGEGNIYSKIAAQDADKQLASASLVYGLYTGYLASNGMSSSASTPVDAVKAAAEDGEFLKYVASNQGKADLAAYKEAMGVINDASGNSDMMKDVLTSGYSNAELIALMQQVLGK